MIDASLTTVYSFGTISVCSPGYENIIQVRALLEGVSVDDMLEHWPEMLSAKMDEYKLERAAMVDLFGSTRDEWMAEDLDGWLAPNRIYDGVAPAMSHAMAAPDAEVYIVTTKQVCHCDHLIYPSMLLASLALRQHSQHRPARLFWKQQAGLL